MERIRILGVGWSEDDLTLGAVKRLRGGDRVVLRTGRCGCGDWLKAEGIPFETLDYLYEQCEDFDELIDLSAQAVLDLAKSSPVVYCVSDLTDKTCSALVALAGEQIELVPGVSEGSCLLPLAGSDVRVISAADADLFEPDVRVSTLVRELDSAMLASDMKLKLTERFPDELEIYLCDASGRVFPALLCEMDRLDEYDHRLCALIPAVRSLDRLERYDMRHLEEIMRRLRDFDGDPWDQKQTHESLRPYLLEEAYEAIDAINRDDTDSLYDELGDVLLQVVFHSDIARQYGEFDLSDVTTAICRKMIRRHPNVFAGMQTGSASDAAQMWNEIKKQEKPMKSEEEMLASVAGNLPALMRAEKIVRRAREYFGEVQDAESAWRQWREAPSEDTLGALLLAIAGAAGESGIDAELALSEAADRLVERLIR